MAAVPAAFQPRIPRIQQADTSRVQKLTEGARASRVRSLAGQLFAIGRSRVILMVDNVDKHCLRAKKAGAMILDEPADQFYGDRRYSAADPEGHHWYFAQHLRDVPVKEMKRKMNK